LVTYQNVDEKQDSKGGRVRWPAYTEQERSILTKKFLGDWRSLDFLEDFWNPICDQGDILQYLRTAEVWRLRLSGKTFQSISLELGIDEGKACALVKGKNLHSYLVQMYLNSQLLPKPRDGWNWILARTPKPTDIFPNATAVPARIQTYQDILDFLKQFSPVPDDHPALEFFGLSSKWVESRKAEFFGFLLGFMVGDAGKNYPEYERKSRRPSKTTLSTNMAVKDSNLRILKYVQLCLICIGIDSHQQESARRIIRWVTAPNNVLTWILRVCLGQSVGERTSRNQIRMDWLLDCPREFIVAFAQGLAESDGHVDKFGRYADIASKTNAVFFVKLLNKIGVVGHAYPKAKPKEVRMSLRESLKLQLFNPLIKSYRYEQMQYHALQKGILPPSLAFWAYG